MPCPQGQRTQLRTVCGLTYAIRLGVDLFRLVLAFDPESYTDLHPDLH